MARSTDSLARYLEWDVRNWSRAIDVWVTECGGSLLTGADVLEVGSRDGGLSLWFADHGAARVVCSDLQGPSPSAHQLHSDAGRSDHIEYQAVDATTMSFTACFDIVAFKSVLGGIGGAGGFEAQQVAVRRMYEALRPGGVLLFAENLVASPLHAFLRRRCVSWGARWRYVTEAELRECLLPFGELTCQTFGFAGAFGRTEGQRDLLARVDVAGVDHLVPRDWRYIIAGVAKKQS